MIAFIRWDDAHDDHLIIVAHFTPIFRESYRIGVPFYGFYEEVLNTDAKEYAGLGFGNQGGVNTEAIAWDNREQSICLHMTPTSVSVFKFASKN